jgi:imidazolonepropionase-like amidohydrolase
MRPEEYVLRGGRVLDTSTGGSVQADIGVSDGKVVEADGLTDATVVDVGGLTVMFGLWDSHAHPGGLMYDPPAQGYFENSAERTIRAGTNLDEAVHMGVTGVRAVGEADGIDIAWAKAFARGDVAGPRLLAAGQSVRTTGGHGTAHPRRYVELEPDIVADGPYEMQRAVRELVERGADWVKLLITGGLYSEHESVDGRQFDEVELAAALQTAHDRGIPVAAHCGSPRVAERFARLGGRSVEHGYALDEASAAVLAECGTWVVPTIGVTHDFDMMVETGWPPHAANRARESAPGHASAVQACVAAGVRIATGADLNPIGPRLHRELALLVEAGMPQLQVLFAATTSARDLMGLGDHTSPQPGAAADLIMIEGEPAEDLTVLQSPRGVMTFGRFVVQPVG